MRRKRKKTDFAAEEKRLSILQALTIAKLDPTFKKLRQKT